MPMRTVVGSFLNAIQNDSSKRHALFMPTAKGPCRFGQYAALNRHILDRTGHNDAIILSPSSDNAYAGLSGDLRQMLWISILTGDMLYKMTLKTRPYEQHTGETDETLAHWMQQASHTIEHRGDLLHLIRRAGEAFSGIPVHTEARPLVGLVGEIFVRNNIFSNEKLVRRIEQAGGEAWMTPFSEWILYTTLEELRNFAQLPGTPSQLMARWKCLLKSRYLHTREKAFHKAAGAIVADRHEPSVKDSLDQGRRYLPFNVGGEALLSLGRAVQFIRQGAALVVNASPFSCMAGTVSAALFSRIENELRVPVVNLFYEGRGEENDRLETFLANIEHNKSTSINVIPTKVGIQNPLKKLDSGFRRNDERGVFRSA